MTKVLLVDDDPTVRAALAITLSGMGLAVSEAMAGDEALTKARVESPDAILWMGGNPEWMIPKYCAS